MLISYSHRFIFIHNTKAAGLSIRAALQPYAQEPEKFKIVRPPQTLPNRQPNPLYEMWQATLLHAKARDIRQELSPAVYRTFYTFAFVRNPWDWQVSMYHFILKEPTHIRYALVKAMRGFDEYLDWVMETEHPYPKGATKFQYEMITDSAGQIIVDYVGRYETLPQDFQTICQHLHLKASLPHCNQSDHRPYQSYYTTMTQQQLAEYFHKDITLFGYTFDGYLAQGGQVGKINHLV
jgi:hypothetical protein